MKNKKRSAFTIVELVIVIAVIAILSAVLIPTFGAIIKDANIAADQTAAATLTTELHVELKGKQITSEEDLMQALTDSGVAEKLVPKSLGYGYHFWFNMETQSIFVAKAEEVEAMPAANLSASVEEPSGAVLASAMLVDNEPQTVTSVFNGIRDIFNKGYILIDSADTLANIFGDMSAIDATGENSYLNYIKNLTDAANNDEIYGIIANAVLNNFKKTVVINGNGVFYFSEAASGTDNLVYFANGVKIISTTHYVYNGTTVDEKTNGTIPTPAGNKISLPSSVVLVEEGALNFATANSVTVKTTHADYQALASVLSPNCSNALFVDTVGNKYIVTNETRGEDTVGVLHQYFDAETATEYKCDLVKRVQFEDYLVGSAETTGLIEWHPDANSELTLYVSISQSGKVTFYMEDTVTKEKSYASVNKWISNNDAIKVSAAGVLTFDTALLATKGYTASITAETYNIYGTKIDQKFNVEIVKPESASIKINGLSHALDGVAKQITLDYDGNTTYDVTLNGVTYSSAHELGTNKITITPAENSIFNVANNKTLSFDISKANNTFIVTVDGCLATEFTVNLNNTELAEFTDNFYKSRTEDRPYYVGEGDKIYLSSLFTAKDTFKGATITIYDQLDNGQYYYVNEINNTNNGVNATISNNNITSETDWNNAYIEFNIDTLYGDYIENDTYLVYIEVTGSNNVSVIYTFNLAEDAKNVKGGDFNSIGTVDSDIVLHGDVSSVANTTKIDLGAHTLYGNGYKINATSYTSAGKNNNQYLNDQFISVSGGTIDNVYINGPIYPELDYDTTTNGYHVSGIEVTGDSTIKNSYVSGFRQPICVDGAKLTLDNTTLYGGNYANLLLIKGSIDIKDVTTVQPANGIADTFGKGKDVIGLGIVVEKDAVAGTTSAINITGYLDQYNWVPENSTADFPTLTIDGSKMNMKTVLSAMFNGLEINFLGKTISRRLAFLDAYLEEINGVQYLNTGIMFMSIGTGNTAKNTYDNRNSLAVTDNRVAGGNIAPSKFTDQELPLFSDYVVMEANLYITTYKLKASQATRLLEKFTIRESDGVVTGSIDLSAFRAITDPLDVYLEVWTYSNTSVDLGADGYPINWTQGYYINYGN